MKSEINFIQEDPALHFLAADDFCQEDKILKRQRLNSGIIKTNHNDMFDTQTDLSSCLDFTDNASKQQTNKGYRFFALALGMMCCSSLLNCANNRQLTSQTNFNVQKMISHSAMISPRGSNSNIEDKLISMNLASREQSNDSSNELKTAQLMKRLQNNVQGPLSGFIKTLIEGQYTK